MELSSVALNCDNFISDMHGRKHEHKRATEQLPKAKLDVRYIVSNLMSCNYHIFGKTILVDSDDRTKTIH